MPSLLAYVAFQLSNGVFMWVIFFLVVIVVQLELGCLDRSHEVVLELQDPSIDQCNCKVLQSVDMILWVERSIECICRR